MRNTLSGTKIAILVANGFNQNDMTAAQKAMSAAGQSVTVISPDQGLVNGWEGNGWGHHFAVDQQLSTALGADFDMLIVPGGQRGLDKLKTTAHTRRFVSSFVISGKPVAMLDDAAELLVFANQASGRTVAGPDSVKDSVVEAGASWAGNEATMDGMLYTGRVSNDEERTAFLSGMLDFFESHATLTRQAA